MATIHVDSPAAREALANALRSAADQIESGHMQHKSGGIVVDFNRRNFPHDMTAVVTIKADLVLEAKPPH